MYWLGYLHQDLLSFDTSETITEVALGAFERVRALEKEIEALGIALEANPEDNDILIKYTDALHELDILDGYNIEHKAEEVLHGLGFTTKDLARPYKEFSGGWRMRVLLAKMILQAPDVLLLDEPTNHLDFEMIEWLADFLSDNKTTLLLVTHDRFFLDAVCNEILEMENQQLYVHRGNFENYLMRKAEREEADSASLDKARNTYRKELEWMRKQPKARTVKSKSRQDAFYEVEEKATSRKPEDKLELNVKMQRLGGKILELKKVYKSYGDKPILKSFDYTFKRGERIGIIGKNGVGKSTVLDALAIALSQLTWRINGHPKKARPIALDDSRESFGHVVARFAEQLMESAV